MAASSLVDCVRGIRDKPTALGSPWQNGFAERLIGSTRRERLDHIVVFGEAHLRRILRSYARYYNEVRTHRSLDKDAPVFRPVQRTGSIKSFPPRRTPSPLRPGLGFRYTQVARGFIWSIELSFCRFRKPFSSCDGLPVSTNNPVFRRFGATTSGDHL